MGWPTRVVASGGHLVDTAMENHDTVIECLQSCGSAAHPPKYPPITFGDYAIWFARKSYEHMAQQPALADAEIAPGARATMRW